MGGSLEPRIYRDHPDSSWYSWKGALLRGLRATGQFSDFVRRRDELKEAGVEVREAWRRAASEFPLKASDIPPPLKEGLQGDPLPFDVTKIDMVSLRGELRERSADISETVKWVSETLLLGSQLSEEVLREAPSASAVSLLLLGMRDPKAFWQLWRDQFQPTRKQASRAAGRVQSERVIGDMISAVESANPVSGDGDGGR
jgi:hypothetical protein